MYRAIAMNFIRNIYWSSTVLGDLKFALLRSGEIPGNVLIFRMFDKLSGRKRGPEEMSDHGAVYM